VNWPTRLWLTNQPSGEKEMEQLLPGLTDFSVAVIIILAAILLSWFSGILLNYFTKRVFRKTTTKLDNVIIAAVTGPVRIAIIVAGFQLAIAQLSFIPGIWEERIDAFFFVVYLLLVYIAVYRLIGGISEWYGDEIVSQTDTDLDDKFLSFFRALANILITLIAFIMLLGHFGIELSALVTTLGIGTLAVALAAQETLSDIISGFMILLDQPFTIGDRVEIQDIDTWGDVKEVGLRSTRILTRDNRMVTIPNSVIGKGLVVNYSDPSTVYRVETHISIAYGTDVDQVREVMVEALRREDWVMKDRLVEALLLNFNDSALGFRVRCWIEHYMETRRVIDKMNTAIYKALNNLDIDISVPLRELKLQDTSIIPEMKVLESAESD
jgi:MscS family membrane protein